MSPSLLFIAVLAPSIFMSLCQLLQTTIPMKLAMLLKNCNSVKSCAIFVLHQKMLTVLIILLCSMSISGIYITNDKVTKVVNLKSQTISYEEVITFVNVGQEKLYHYVYLLDPNTKNVYIEFKQPNGDELPFTKNTERTFSANLSTPVEPQGKETIHVYVVVLDALPILDLSVSNRVVKYVGNLQFYSPFNTLDFTVTYEINDEDYVIEMVPAIPLSKTKAVHSITMIPPYQYVELRIFYVNNNPFYVVTRLDRRIDISHFGFISIEDKVEVVNAGPKVKGPFSPSPGSDRTDFYTYLPASASSIKLFDDIGNNSKSTVRYTEDAVILSFQPRYHLQRSWKTIYTLQYTVPAYEYLRRWNNTYVLKMRTVDYTLPYAIVKYAETRVILPSDSDLVAVRCAEGQVEDGGLEFATTALAPRRIVVVLVSRDLVHETVVPEFSVEYHRCPLRLFKPGIYIVAYVEACFLVYLFTSYNRPKLSIN